MNSKWFGILSGIGIGFLITFTSFVFRINLIANNTIGKIPIYFWLVFFIGFLSFTFFKKGIDRKIFNYSYLGLTIVSFIYLNSFLNWTVECCPENYVSMSDWNASKALAWIFHLPFVFVVMMILGLLFDTLREKNLNNQFTTPPSTP